MPTDEVVVAAPPTITGARPSLLQTLLPVLGGASMVAFAVVYDNPLFLIVAGVLVGVSLLGAIALRLEQARTTRRERRGQRERYRHHLADREAALTRVAEAQHEAGRRLYPDPEQLWAATVGRHHLWERRREDVDFCHVRLGRGDVALAAPVRLRLDDSPLVAYEPDLLAAAQDLMARYERLAAEPVVAELVGLGSLTLSGPPARTRALARWLLLQLAANHAPDDVRILGYFPPDAALAWDWLKWLPHARGGPGADDRVATDLTCDPNAFDQLLDEVLRPRLEQLARQQAAAPGNATGEQVSFQQVVVVVDGYDPAGALARSPALETLLARGALLHTTVLCLVEGVERAPSSVGAVVELSPSGRLAFTEAGRPDGRRLRDVLADQPDVAVCEAVARALAPVRLGNRQGRTEAVESDRLLELLGLAEPRDLQQAGPPPPRAGPQLLRVPFGVREDGQPVELDLKESAAGGMGPHGLVVGATGSGKSELLRTVVTALALTHPPDQLNFVFADFKGGASFAELARLPHTAGMITNLQRDLTMVDRMYDALYGEQERRQRLLRDAGNLDSIREYQARRATAGDDAPPLPYLVLVVDEFGELLASRPDFLDLFVTLARTGRSLGIHLLLATQRLDEGRIRSLEGHLRYRICLRTFSPDESQAVLGTRDAFALPPLPGLGFFKVDERTEQFKSALVTAPYRPPQQTEAPAATVAPFSSVATPAATPTPRPPQSAPAAPGTERSEMELAIEVLSRPGRDRGDAAAHQVWLPLLPVGLALNVVFDHLGLRPGERGPRLGVPVGLLDRPRDQVQEPLMLDLSGAGGHVAIVGAPRTGKSVLVRTLVSAVALAHPPDEVHVYAIDLGGGTLHALEALPHVGTVCGRADRERIEATVRELRLLLEERASLWRRHGITTMAEYRDRRRRGELGAQGELADLTHGEVFLVVDNWSLLRQELDPLEAEITELAASGLHYGLHLVVTSGRWGELRPALRDSIGTRLELRLHDPLESEIGRRPAEGVPAGVPGRGLVAPGRQFQAALPRLDGVPDDLGLTAAAEALARTAAAAWDAPSAPPIRLLPTVVGRRELPAPTEGGAGVPIGLEEAGLAPLYLDLFAGDPHFLVFGDGEAGKTNLLRVWLGGLLARYRPDEVQVDVVDPRRSLLDLAEGPHVAGYACTGPMTEQLAQRLAAMLADRLPPPDSDRQALAGQPRWQGPPIVLFVDDYDLVAGPASNPLAGLVDYLALGRDVGFHVVVARRVGGSTRGSFEPFFARVRELGSPGLILSGDPGEGPLLGNQKAAVLPPGRGFLVRRGRPTAVVQVALDREERDGPDLRVVEGRTG